MDSPKDLVAAVPSVSPHDFARACWDTGAMDIDIIKWSDNIAHQEEPFSVWNLLSSARVQKLDATIKSVPLAQNVEEHHSGKAAWLDRILAKSDITDPHYSPMRLGEALKRTQIPILIITGWYDLFIQQSIEQYMELKERGCNVSLTVGPWNHMKGSFAPKTSQHGLDWIDEHLGKSQEAKRKAPVQYFVTGAEEWRDAAVYPVPTIPSIFYLHGDGQLSNDTSANDSALSTFTYNPQNPTPNMGGNGLLSGGRADDTELANRDDVLTFDSTTLEGDMEICGTTTVEFTNSTSTPFADVFVRVSEVDAKGKSKNVTETFRRLDPKRDQNESLKLTLNHCSHRFLKGNKIRVMIAGGNFPQYTRNQGVENSDNRASEMRSVEHTIYHDKLRVSKVVFPLVSESSL
jgi:putative CocE/NonD family hydrolase